MEEKLSLRSNVLWVIGVFILNEDLLVPTLMYGIETMVWREKERSRISAGQIDNLRGILSIRSTHIMPNPQVKELCGMKKVMDKSVLWGFGHLEEWGIVKLLK